MSPPKVLVAIHGIGDQTRYETLQHLVNLCFGHYQRPRGVPIGLLHSRLATEPWATVSALPDLAFAEVFWADIGRDSEQYVLEESVAWSHTIVERLAVISNWLGIVPPPFDRIRIKHTLTDLGIAIRLTRWLNRGLAAIGVGSVDVEKLLVRFLGDVQLYAEFQQLRGRIMERFNAVVERVASQHPDVEIHLCAHSQGSVVAFLGLLEGHRAKAPWLSRVRSLMTVGSPIDTFLVLWPELWLPFTALPAGASSSGPGIRWFNYADRGDPVGYGLEIARLFVHRFVPGLFAPEAPKERIFRRYLVPGKAHIDYWRDQNVFDEWLGSTVLGSGPTEAPADRRAARIVAPILPFAVSAGFALVAAHFFVTGLNQIYESGDLGMAPMTGITGVLSIALLVLGTVSLASASRTSLRWRWFLLGVALMAAGALATLREIAGAPHRWLGTEAFYVVVGLTAVALVQNVLNWVTTEVES
jgi:pimeloyl-ACP methyl ester carboxylesterase